MLRLVLFLFAALGLGGAGAALALVRHRRLADGERDVGTAAVAVMLFAFGVACAGVAGGALAVPAFGAVACWAGYLLMAQHLGLFRVEARGRSFHPERRAEESRRVP